MTDGTTIQLNTNTEVRTRLSADSREIKLVRGEALIKVAADPQRRPLTVTAGNATAHAPATTHAGTAFVVRNRPHKGVEFGVTDGAITLEESPYKIIDVALNRNPAEEATLMAGDLARVRPEGIHFERVGLEELNRKLGWLTGVLAQDQLRHSLFPLGGYTKPEVREQARAYDLGIATKPDSQEICFIPGGDYKRFIDAYLDEQGETIPDSSGELVTTAGTVAGHHEGIHQFTVGQRKGLGVASPSPLYVLSIHPHSHQVTIGSEDELLCSTLVARQLNWISVADLIAPMRVKVKIRHRHEPAFAVIEKTGRDEVTATFDEPVRAVTPGQAAVFYQQDVVVGGGWIAAL